MHVVGHYSINGPKSAFEEKQGRFIRYAHLGRSSFGEQDL